jgi:hypothetical protein
VADEQNSGESDVRKIYGPTSIDTRKLNTDLV